MKFSELINLSPSALSVKLAGLYQELINLRFKRAAAQLKNPLLLRRVRRDIARLKTAMARSEKK